MFDPRVPTLAAALALALAACVDRGASTHATGTGPASAVTTAEAGTCGSDADCHRTGCSGEVCSDHDMLTSCLWRSEYACYGEPFARCTCGAGTCGWAPDPSLTACLAHARTP